MCFLSFVKCDDGKLAMQAIKMGKNLNQILQKFLQIDTSRAISLHAILLQVSVYIVK